MEDDAQRQLGLAADLIGTAAGVFLDQKGVVGSGIGSIVGVGIAGVIKEMAARAYTLRQKNRIKTALDIAQDRIGAQLIAGHIVRADGFFVERDLGQSDGSQLLESTLVKVSTTFQEKKIRHIGLFYANLIFADYISAETAHMLLSQLERMSYRQYALLALLGKVQTLDVEHLRRPSHEDPELAALKREEMDLHANDLGTGGLIEGDGPWVDKLSTLGKVIFDLAGLSEFDADDLAELCKRLSVANQ